MTEIAVFLAFIVGLVFGGVIGAVTMLFVLIPTPGKPEDR